MSHLSGPLVVTKGIRNGTPEASDSIYKDVVKSVRKRFTAAQVNASGGTPVVEGIPGHKLRLVNATLVAVGGNSAGATHVELASKQGESAVKLVRVAVAGLADNAVTNMFAASNVTLLNAGASLASNNAGEPINITRVTNNLTGATHVDVILEYVVEED